MTRRAAILSNLLISFPLATGLLCAANAAAQAATPFNVPFAFTANHQHVGAGFYQVRVESGRLLYLRSIRTGKTQIVMVRPDWGSRDATRSSMVFHRNGSQTYLEQVWIAGTPSALIERPKVEKEQAKQISTDRSYVEVASK